MQGKGESDYNVNMSAGRTDYYAILGVEPDSSAAEIRAAYRQLAKQVHPDRNRDATDAVRRTQELNAAYETLRHPARRRAYDAADGNSPRTARPRASAPLRKGLFLSIEELLRGVTMQVRVDDPGAGPGDESYELVVPPETPPGSVLRIRRDHQFGGAWLLVRVKARPNARFKARGSDLRTDLMISVARARSGGQETIRDAEGRYQPIQIPAATRRGTEIRLRGRGLPKKRGGRGDLLVRIVCRPEVRFARRA